VCSNAARRKLVRIVGRKETVGRPLLYGTTLEFLKHFGLSHLSELPSIEELTPPENAAPELTGTDDTQELPFRNPEEPPAAETEPEK